MQDISTILKTVSKPGRYTGGEYGQIIKDKNEVKARVAFCFPDTYEIGMSNLGMRILYGVLNKEENVWCERVYDPWIDMQEKMREYNIPLTACESGDPLTAFDFVGFTLQYEMSYTNVLNMLDLAGIPLRSADRDDSMPIVIGGGPCAYNAEPVADFFDLFSGFLYVEFLFVVESENNIFGRRKNINKFEMLMNHTDFMRKSIFG
jgi:hypothetical protein